jgi:hypothetical protein
MRSFEKYLLIAAVIFVAVACQKKEILRGNGQPAPEPAGATEGCKLNPSAAYCQEKKK